MKNMRTKLQPELPIRALSNNPEDVPMISLSQREGSAPQGPVTWHCGYDVVENQLHTISGSAISGTQNNNKIHTVMNRNSHQHELIVSGIHLDLTPSLKTFVREKVERLFRHEERIIRIRIELECDSKQSVSNRFVAKGHITIQGPELCASVSSDECHKSVAFLVDKLDRMLQRRNTLNKVKRHKARALDLDVELPKAV